MTDVTRGGCVAPQLAWLFRLRRTLDRARGINEAGELLVEDEQGRTEKVFSGEVEGDVIYFPSFSISQSIRNSAEPLSRGYAVPAR